VPDGGAGGPEVSTVGAADADAVVARSLSRWKRLLSVGAAIVVLVAVFGFALPKFASYQEAWTAIAAMSAAEIVVLGLTAVVKLLIAPWQMMAALPGLGYGDAFAVNESSTALSNTLPAGGAFGVGLTFDMLHASGNAPNEITREIIVTGVWNDLVKLVLPVAALLLLAIEQQATRSELELALIGLLVSVTVIVLLVLVVRSQRMARAIGDWAARVISHVLHWVRRAPAQGWGERLVEFDQTSGELVAQRWIEITAATLAGQISVFAIFYCSARFVGIHASTVGFAELFATWVFARLLQLIPITPGGLGFVQLGLTGLLTAFGAPNDQAVAATLVYTALTWFPPIPVGATSYWIWRAHHPLWRRAAIQTVPGNEAATRTPTDSSANISPSPATSREPHTARSTPSPAGPTHDLDRPSDG
jgi:uncharacterized protein (TIRG00374 family)